MGNSAGSSLALIDDVSISISSAPADIALCPTISSSASTSNSIIAVSSSSGSYISELYAFASTSSSDLASSSSMSASDTTSPSAIPSPSASARCFEAPSNFLRNPGLENSQDPWQVDQVQPATGWTSAVSSTNARSGTAFQAALNPSDNFDSGSGYFLQSGVEIPSGTIIRFGVWYKALRALSRDSLLELKLFVDDSPMPAAEHSVNDNSAYFLFATEIPITLSGNTHRFSLFVSTSGATGDIIALDDFFVEAVSGPDGQSLCSKDVTTPSTFSSVSTANPSESVSPSSSSKDPSSTISTEAVLTYSSVSPSSSISASASPSAVCISLPTNCLTNPGFENSVLTWEAGGYEGPWSGGSVSTNDDYRHGNSAHGYEASTGGTALAVGYFQQSLSSVPTGTTIVASVWVKMLRPIPAASSLDDYFEIEADIGNDVLGTVRPSEFNNWVQYTTQPNVIKDNSKIFRFWVRTKGSTGPTLAFDDFSVEPIVGPDNAPICSNSITQPDVSNPSPTPEISSLSSSSSSDAASSSSSFVATSSSEGASTSTTTSSASLIVSSSSDTVAPSSSSSSSDIAITSSSDIPTTMSTVIASSIAPPTPEPSCFNQLPNYVKNGDFERGWNQGQSSMDYWGYTQSSGKAFSYLYTWTYVENGRKLPGSNVASVGFRARTMDSAEGPSGAQDTTISLSQTDIYVPAGTKVEVRAWIWRFISCDQIQKNGGIFTAVLKFDGVLVGTYDFPNTFTNTWYQIGTTIGTGTGKKKIDGVSKLKVEGDYHTVTVEVHSKGGPDTLIFAVDDVSVTVKKEDFPETLKLC